MSNIKTQIKDLIQNLKQVFLRFPLACFFALVLTVMVSYYILEGAILEHEHLFYSTIIGCGIGILLAFSADLFCHLRQLKLSQRIWCNVAVVLTTTICIGVIHANFDSTSNLYYYIFTLIFAALLILLVWPMLGKRDVEITWNYHFRLLFGIAVAYIMAFIIILGIVAILTSVAFLFNVDIDDTLYIAITIICAFLFPCCIMALMPINQEAYDKPLAYNKFMKVLVLYILLPLVCLEALVLYIYAIKILFAWELPEGGVAYWVFSYAIAASIVWYLLMPVFRSEQPSKLKFLDRGFFISLIPLLVLLFVGLFRRIHDYGFTTNRYIVLVIAIWFMAIAWIMIFRKSRNVTPLLSSLVIISLLALVGPWSMFSLPKSMQIKRFEKIVNEYHLLGNGKIVPSVEPLSREQNIALSESLDFFIDTKEYQHDFTEHYFGFSPEKTDSLIENYSYNGFKELLMDQMNGEYIDKWDRRSPIEEVSVVEDNRVYTFYNKDDDKLYDISQYDYTFTYCAAHDYDCFQADHVKITISDDSLKNNILRLHVNNNIFDINVIDSLKLKSHLKESWNKFPLNGIFHEDAQVKLFLNVQYCRIEKDSTGALSTDMITLDGYVKLKN